MAQPTIYTPAYNFTSYQTANPSLPLPADKLDTELAALKTTTDSVRTNMALLQADDGTLKAQMVTTTSLATSTLALLAATTGTVRGTWAAATAYVAKDVVVQSAATYVCVVAHTSGVFATDLTEVKWVLLAGSTGSVAFSSLSDVTITAPASGQALSWNGTRWVNGSIVAANIADATVTFAKMAAAFSITDTGLVGSSNTNVPTTAAAKAYVDAQVSRGTGTPVAAAATTSLTGNTFDYVSVTGNTGITAITLATAEQCWVVFTGTPILTHNAVSLILPGAANITAAAGDRALFRGLNGSNVECLSYVRASGQAVVVPASTSGLVLISTQTISSPVASVDFTSGIDGTYSRYLLTITGLRASTASELRTRFYRSAAWLAASAYVWECAGRVNGFTTEATGLAATHLAILATTINMGMSTASDDGIGMNIEFGDTVASQKVAIGWQAWGRGNNGLIMATGSGTYTTAGALEGIQFYASSGNLAGGTFKLYGMV